MTDLDRTIFVYMDKGVPKAAVGDVDLRGDGAGEVDIDFGVEEDGSVTSSFAFDMSREPASSAAEVSGYGIVITNAEGQNNDVSQSFTLRPNPNHPDRPQIRDSDAANSGQYNFSVTVYDEQGTPAPSDPRIYNR